MENPTHGSFRAAFISFLVVLAVYTLFAGGTPDGRSPNEQSRLELSVAIAKHGSVSLDPVLSTYGSPFDRAEREGRTYSDKAPGLSLLGVPIAWIADLILPREANSSEPSYWGLRHLLTWLLVTLPAALFPFVVLRCFRSGPFSSQSIRIAVLFALVTPVMTYSGLFFGHVTSGILAAFAWMLTLCPRESSPSIHSAAQAGLLLALAATIEYPTAIVGLVIFPTMAFRKLPARTLAAFGAACLIGLLPCLIYHQVAFGSPFTTGYAFKGDSWHAIIHKAGFFGVTTPRLEHIWGVLGGMKRGVLFYCPLLILIPFGLVHMERQNRFSSYPYTTLGIAYLLFAAGFSDWQAGWSAAARHLVPCVMIFIFPLSHAIQFITSNEKKNKGLEWVLLCTVAFSMTGSFLSLCLSPFFPEHFTSPLGQLVLPAMAEGYFAPTLLSGTDLSSRGFAIGGLAIMVLAAVSWALSGIMRSMKIRFVITVLLITSTLLYAGLIWSLAQPLEEDQRQMRIDVLKGIGYSFKMQSEQRSEKGRYAKYHTQLNLTLGGGRSI